MKPSIPTFYTSRLILRPITLSDSESYEKNFVDYDVISHLSALVPWPYPKGGVAQFLSNVILPPQGDTRWTWGICLKTNPSEVIGCVDIWREGRPENRGFWLGKRFWGQGIMTEAVQPVTDYAFRELEFKRLVFANAVGNNRSRRIKEKTGARLLHIAPAQFVNPAYTEHEVWELTQEDWILNRGGGVPGSRF
jgi:RimJ/RimL family protein N-acetyltransferase